MPAAPLGTTNEKQGTQKQTNGPRLYLLPEVGNNPKTKNVTRKGMKRRNAHEDERLFRTRRHFLTSNTSEWMVLPASLPSSCWKVDRGTSTTLDVARAALVLRWTWLLKRGTRWEAGGGRQKEGIAHGTQRIPHATLQAGCYSSGGVCFLRSRPCF